MMRSKSWARSLQGAALCVAMTATAQAQAPAVPEAAEHHHPAVADSVASWAQGAQLFDGLGSFRRKISTRSAEAQRYFDQGMRLLWAFNHDEATRSFARAAQADPGCASCYWGVALTLGPNYNMPMMAEARARAGWEALGKAQANADRTTPVEKALIEALAKRFSGPTPLDPTNMAPLLAAHAEAMKAVAARFPKDNDVQTLYAESLMNTNPWKLWTQEGTPNPGTAEIVAALEGVLKRDPSHPGANHYYVHAIEASPKPEQGVAAAERLKTAMPAAGHMVHMPAHIMQRVGRYAEAAEANRLASIADAAYYEKTSAPDYYPMYTAHNYQFLAYSAAMEGRRAETIAALRKAREALPDAMLSGMPGQDWVVAFLYDAMVRFGMWDELLAEDQPDQSHPGLAVGHLSARIIALASTGRLEEANLSVPVLDTMIAATPDDYPAGMNSARAAYAVAAFKAKARIALAEKRTDDAIALLRQGVAAEDALSYNEPADAFFPVRHMLGAVLLDAGRPADAEAVYRDDLKRNPANGWALFGLAKALEAQGKAGEAVSVRSQLVTAWQRADITLAASAY